MKLLKAGTRVTANTSDGPKLGTVVKQHQKNHAPSLVLITFDEDGKDYFMSPERVSVIPAAKKSRPVDDGVIHYVREGETVAVCGASVIAGRRTIATYSTTCSACRKTWAPAGYPGADYAIRVNDRVTSATYGEGTVLSIEHLRGPNRYWVLFDQCAKHGAFIQLAEQLTKVAK